MYALAKELNLDSKVLVDICTRAGIPGKGSALASLTEDEVVKLKEYMSGGGRPARKPAAGAVGVAAPTVEAGTSAARPFV